MIDSLSNPYVGPQTFRRKHQHLFFGRDREAQELASLVLSERITLFYAPSGAGKSSLINTRLVTYLQARGFSFYPPARVGQTLRKNTEHVDNIFIFNLLDSLTQGSQDQSVLNDVSVVDFLSRNPPPIPSNIDETVLIEHPPRILIIDQFEEIITTHLDRWAEREVFFKQIAQAISKDPLLWVIFVLREDYVEALSPYAHLLPGRMQARYHMQRMGQTAALDAICKPAEIAKRPFTPEAAQQLLSNLRQIHTEVGYSAGKFIEPVQLQVVCYQLWEDISKQEQFSNWITIEDVHEFGDVDSALTHFYESTINDVVATTTASVLGIRVWFEHELITETGARGTVHQGEHKTGSLPNRFVKALADRFLLRQEQRAGSFWFELVHERFITPIIQSNKRWLDNQHTAIRQAVDWHIAGRPIEKLLSDQPVDDVHNELASEFITVEFIQAFLDASAAAQASKHRAEALRQEQEAKKSERESRRRILMLSIFIPLAIMTIIWALSQVTNAQEKQRDAEMEKETAVTNIAASDLQSTRAAIQKETAVADGEYVISLQQTAVAESGRADMLRVTAVAASTSAAQQVATAEAAGILAQEIETLANEARQTENLQEEAAVEAAGQAGKDADLLLAQTLINEAGNSTDRELGALLLLHAQQLQLAHRADTAQVNEALFDTLYQPGFGSTLAQHDGAINEVAFSPVHNTETLSIASVGQDGSLLLTVLGDITEHTTFEQADTPLNTVIFTPDGNHLITSGSDGSITLWAVENSSTPLEVVTADSPVLDMIISPNGETVYSSHDDGSVQSRTLAELNSPPTIISTWGEAASRPIAIDGSNGQLLIGDPDGAIEKWLINSNPPRFTGKNEWQPRPFIVLDHHDDGVSYLYENGKMRVERPISYLKLEGVNDPSILGVSPNGRFAVAGNINGDLSLWLMPNELILRAEPNYTFNAHNGTVQTIDWSPDSTLFVTGGRDGVLRLWKATTALFDPLPSADIITMSPTESLMITANRSSNADRAILYDMDALPLPLDVHDEDQGEITAVSFSADGQQIALAISTASSGMIRLGDLSARTFDLSDYRWFLHPVYAVAFSPDGRYIAIGGKSDGIILVYDLTAPESQAIVLRGHKTAVEHLLFLADSSALISATGHNHYPNTRQEEGTHVWNSADFTSSTPSSRPLTYSSHGASGMALSGDGTLLAIASDSIQIWQTDGLSVRPEEVLSSRLPSHTEDADRIGFSSLAFSPDAKSLIATDYVAILDSEERLSSVRLWLLDTPGMEPLILGHEMQTFAWLSERHRYENNTASYFNQNIAYFNATGFSADSHYFIIADDTETIVGETAAIWPSIICQQARRDLTEEEWLHYFDNRPYQAICTE